MAAAFVWSILPLQPRSTMAFCGMAAPEPQALISIASASLGTTRDTSAGSTTRKAGADIRALLQKDGLIRDSGHEHFNGSLVVPVFDEAANVIEVYGRNLLDKLRAATPKHLYLPAREGRTRGVFNMQALAASNEIILCEAVLDVEVFGAAHRGAPFQRRSSSALLTTLTLLKAMAAPAITGLNRPNAASGMPTTL